MANFDVKSMIRRIESVLVQKGMSKEEFYTKSGVSSASYSQWNTGTHKPTSKKIFAMAECLGVSVQYLTGEEEIEKPTLQMESELNPDYFQLSETNKAIVDSMIAQLLAAQSND